MESDLCVKRLRAILEGNRRTSGVVMISFGAFEKIVARLEEYEAVMEELARPPHRIEIRGA